MVYTCELVLHYYYELDGECTDNLLNKLIIATRNHRIEYKKNSNVITKAAWKTSRQY